jgi:hypothetical protein
MATWQHPTAQTLDRERGLSRLVFGADSVAPSGIYLMRGGVCWPQMQVDDRYEGAALLLGVHVDSQRAYVLAERRFVCVEPILEDDGSISDYPALAGFLNHCWATYFCSRWFWHGDWETHRTWLIKVLRAALIQPKPKFIESDWREDAAALAQVGALEETGRFKYPRDGLLRGAIKDYSARHDLRHLFPALQAAMAAVAGLERIKIGPAA